MESQITNYDEVHKHMSKYQIVYSKKLTELLMERGFIFDKVAPNPQYP